MGAATASASLLAANEQLLALRAAQGIAHRPTAPAAPAAGRPTADPQPGDRQPTTAHEARVGSLPPHLGWGSDRLTAYLRRRLAADGGSADGRLADGGSADPYAVAAGAPQPRQHPRAASQRRPEPVQPAATVKLYPDLALGMLRRDLAAAGRIWLLLRHLDGDGRGWVAVDDARAQLTGKTSPRRVCGWRQLRNLLRQGAGTFWRRDKTRIWLRGAARVAAALEVGRLRGRPVSLPVDVLCGAIGDVRAHFYASFHAGRRSDNPISRAALTEITGVPGRTQRAYERAAGVAAEPCYAVLGLHSADRLRESAWLYRGVFLYKDTRGRVGRAGARYVARRLPNQYRVDHTCFAARTPHGVATARPLGRQRKINRQLKDLVNLPAQGNGSEAAIERRYFQSADTWVRSRADERYWRDWSADGSWWHGSVAAIEVGKNLP